jgi:hypothetical protein
MSAIPAWSEHRVLETSNLQLEVYRSGSGWHWALRQVGVYEASILNGPPWNRAPSSPGFASEAEAKADALETTAAWLEARAAELRAVQP